MKKVIVYSTPVCPHCIELKEMLKRHGISFEERNVFEDDEARDKLMKAGLSHVPVVEVDGKLISDFTNDELLKAIK
jgi:glutaredoxin